MAFIPFEGVEGYSPPPHTHTHKKAGALFKNRKFHKKSLDFYSDSSPQQRFTRFSIPILINIYLTATKIYLKCEVRFLEDMPYSTQYTQKWAPLGNTKQENIIMALQMNVAHESEHRISKKDLSFFLNDKKRNLAIVFFWNTQKWFNFE